MSRGKIPFKEIFYCSRKERMVMVNGHDIEVYDSPTLRAVVLGRRSCSGMSICDVIIGSPKCPYPNHYQRAKDLS